MNRLILSSICCAAFVGTTLLAGAPKAEASKPWKKLLEMGCAKCHTSKLEPDMSELDLTATGKKALKYMKLKGLKPDAEQEKTGKTFLAGFKESAALPAPKNDEAKTKAEAVDKAK
jgi:hypothetical protein